MFMPDPPDGEGEAAGAEDERLDWEAAAAADVLGGLP
jgi:hypothetical protein